ncbi:hypothetical protein FC093_13925 [Ilyomonas limi]|uniref:Uncharacterized protein n=1 Tax=Ilyomonas limi TaxID=2575867 RepID=A0A4U3KXP5_9BACT|nr:hypothetical protein [Ilyomonas limi]TKK67395.1 hypothetical protein FC093_13925 [Ilyomonas limi]
MAKQTGILPIEGTIGNLTFFKSKEGFLVRSKGGIAADKIATDPAFQRTRENMAEFSRAGKGAKLLRTAFRAALIKSKDQLIVSRLTTQMLKVVQADDVNDRGLRNVIDGEALLLEGFEFNRNARLSATLYAPFTASLVRSSGAATVTVPGFVPLNMVTAPTGTTHFRLFSGAAAIDFENESYEVDTAVTAEMVYGNTAIADMSLTCALPGNSTYPLFLVFGIEFLQQVNGKMYPLNNGTYNACSLIKVDAPV